MMGKLRYLTAFFAVTCLNTAQIQAEAGVLAADHSRALGTSRGRLSSRLHSHFRVMPCRG